jgi:hypothetical protein
MNIRPKNDRSIFENISFSISSIANVIGAGASAVSTAAETFDVLAGTGLVMATNLQEVTMIESRGRKEEKLAELREKYPELTEVADDTIA